MNTSRANGATVVMLLVQCTSSEVERRFLIDDPHRHALAQLRAP